MASRDNQTLQIFVIALTLVVILLGALAIWLNGAKNTAIASAKDAKQRADQASSSERELQRHANSYKQWMGFQAADTYDTLQKSFGEDMERFGSTYDENSRFYRTILENLFDENNKLAQGEADAKEQVKELKQRLLATETEKNQQIANFEAVAKKAQADKASEHNKFQQQREEMAAKQEELASQLAEQRAHIDKIRSDHADVTKAHEAKIAKLERVITILKNNQAVADPYAQPADGLIRYVDQREDKVWINLGSADRLRPQVTFSVYSGDSTDINAAESKGSIEVTRILSEHMAEARITASEPKRPLMEGDKVFSQIWSRGRQVGFAITGKIDLDGDGRSDLERLRQIVLLNNGKVDAVPADDGTIDGEMTASTRYLILGEHPAGSNEQSAAARKAWETMSAEADTLNIEAIMLDEFLGLMGWHSGEGAQRTGRSGDAVPNSHDAGRDAVPRDPVFRRRKPQVAY